MATFKCLNFKQQGFLLLALFTFIGCAGGPIKKTGKPSIFYPPKQARPYKINGVWYSPLSSAEGYRQKGIASWYGSDFHGRKTANGERYNMFEHTAAHKTLPFNTYLKVTNLENGRSTVVRVNDRGPFVKNRIIDLSYTAAKELGMAQKGTAPVRIEAIALTHYRPQGKKHWLVEKPRNLYAGNFTIQVGSFTRPGNAYSLQRKLIRTYPNVEVVPYQLGEKVFYRVRLLHFSNLFDAQRATRQFWKRGYLDAFVVAK